MANSQIDTNSDTNNPKPSMDKLDMESKIALTVALFDILRAVYFRREMNDLTGELFEHLENSLHSIETGFHGQDVRNYCTCQTKKQAA